MTKSGFDISAGLYWIRCNRKKTWTVAEFDGTDELCWALLCTDMMFDWDELFEVCEDGDPPSFPLGPRVTEPLLEQAS